MALQFPVVFVCLFCVFCSFVSPLDFFWLFLQYRSPLFRISASIFGVVLVVRLSSSPTSIPSLPLVVFPIASRRGSTSLGSLLPPLGLIVFLIPTASLRVLFFRISPTCAFATRTVSVVAICIILPINGTLS